MVIYSWIVLENILNLGVGTLQWVAGRLGQTLHSYAFLPSLVINSIRYLGIIRARSFPINYVVGRCISPFEVNF
jgi:hypothetical protein